MLFTVRRNGTPRDGKQEGKAMSEAVDKPQRPGPAPDGAPASGARRGFLRRATTLSGGALAAGAAFGAGRAIAQDSGRNLPPNVPEWSQALGAPILTSPYGLPSKYESKLQRRNSPGLTRTPHSSVSFTPLQTWSASSRRPACISSAITRGCRRSIRTSTV
jgi:hypothetical protein